MLRTCSLPVHRGLAVVAVLPLAILVPRVAHASPSTLTAMQTVAVANDPGVAEALVVPAGPSATTRVTVEVSTENGEPAPATAPVTTPAPLTAPEPKPAPPPHHTDYTPRPEDVYREQARDDRKSGSGLLTGGLALVGASYVATSLAGALAIDRSRDLVDDPATELDEGLGRAQRRAYGRALMIPGIGPALAIARADTAVRAWAAGMSGLTQAVGTGLAVLGIHRLVRARRLERLSLSAMGSSREAHVALRVRF